MAVRTFYQEPPFRADVVDAQKRVTAPWHLWFSFATKSLAREIIVDSTADPPNLGSGAAVSATVTVPGAEEGDFALASFVTANVGISLSAQVTSANTVTVWFFNLSGGAIDLPAGTLRVWVRKVS